MWNHSDEINKLSIIMHELYELLIPEKHLSAIKCSIKSSCYLLQCSQHNYLVLHYGTLIILTPSDLCHLHIWLFWRTCMFTPKWPHVPRDAWSRETHKMIFFLFLGWFLNEEAQCAHTLCSTGSFLQMVSLLCIEKPSLDLHLVNFLL